MAEKEKINSDNEFKISKGDNEPSIYEINTATIYLLLTQGSDIDFDTEKWRKYDRKFLAGKFQNALKSILTLKNVVHVEYDGENGAYLKDYEKGRYPAHLESAKDPDNFPFPYYFLERDLKLVNGDPSGYWNIFNYMNPCIVNKNDTYFELFFALQFSLTDIVQGTALPANDFLKYHLQSTFDNDIQKFQDFLENLCLEYSEFLKDKYEPLIKQFIEKIRSAKKEQVNEKTTIHSGKTAKLNWRGSPSQFGYLFSELAKKGFIDLPSTNGQGSYSKYAKVCWELFDFHTKTTSENLQKEMNPNKNTLSEGVRAKFTIPELSEISKK